MKRFVLLLALIAVPESELAAQTKSKPTTRPTHRPNAFNEVHGEEWAVRRIRRLGRRNRGIARAINLGLAWIADHQDEDGGFSADTFMRHEVLRWPGHAVRTDAPGEDLGRVGITSLCLLAFLGDGQTLRRGGQKEVVKKAVAWLRKQQKGTGALTSADNPNAMLEHFMGTQALCEACGRSKSRVLNKSCLGALAYLVAQQNADGGWSHVAKGKPSNAFATYHAVRAYCAGRGFGLVVDQQDQSLARTGEWLEKVTGKDGSITAVGRVPIAGGERSKETAMSTALLIRFFLGQDPKKKQIMRKVGEALVVHLPSARTLKQRCPEFWYPASHAMFQLGGTYWRRWQKPLRDAVQKTQRMDGLFVGTWDPLSQGAIAGGRMYATALSVLTLESYCRYSQAVR